MTRLDLMFLLLIDQGFYKLMTGGSPEHRNRLFSSLDYLEAEKMIEEDEEGNLSVTAVGIQTLRNFSL